LSKAKVVQNAVKHGLLAKEAVVVGEDFDQFDLYREQIRAELGPVGLVESVLAEWIVGLSRRPSGRTGAIRSWARRW